MKVGIVCQDELLRLEAVRVAPQVPPPAGTAAAKAM